MEFVPEFNVLYLFVPSEGSFHMVSPVSEDLNCESNRFTVTGFFESEKECVNTQGNDVNYQLLTVDFDEITGTHEIINK